MFMVELEVLVLWEVASKGVVFLLLLLETIAVHVVTLSLTLFVLA